nr:TM1266 family iron-only hydrogenase system putative regulator [uncultured Cellulosilyticum sp.]
MNRIAVISAILENPKECQLQFNEVVASFRGNTKGRMGIPLDEEISVISIVVTGSLDEINSLTGKLGKIQGVTVKTAIAKKEIE